jgi:multiple sugar transport system ATP-binding protein
VAVGRAIVRQPKAFLFDEPLSNLDAKLRVEMRAELKRLHHTLQTTTIYVTHDQEEAMTLGDRIVVMKDGLVHQCGAPLEVYDTPANRFVAGFVGTPPMNFFDGTLAAEGHAVFFDEGTFRLRLSDQQAAKLLRRAGQKVVLGVRPEAMALAAGGRFAGQDNVMPVQVVVLEPLGEKMDIYASTRNHPHIVARVDARRDVQSGHELKLYLDMQKIHVFEPGETGANLGLDAKPATA